MARRLSTRRAPGTWVVRAGGAVLGESANAVELVGGDGAPVIYFPRADLAMAFLDRSETTTHCPQLGAASYYTIEAKSGPIGDAAWSYESPGAGFEAIANHLAFDPERVAIERL